MDEDGGEDCRRGQGWPSQYWPFVLYDPAYTGSRPTLGRSALCTAQSRHCKDLGFGVGLGGLVVITAGQ